MAKKVADKSKLSKRAREILDRTKKAKAERDAYLEGVVIPEGPVMILLEKHEQPQEPTEMAISPAEREVRARKTSKAREKRSALAKARRATTTTSDTNEAEVSVAACDG